MRTTWDPQGASVQVCPRVCHGDELWCCAQEHTLCTSEDHILLPDTAISTGKDKGTHTPLACPVFLVKLPTEQASYLASYELESNFVWWFDTSYDKRTQTGCTAAAAEQYYDFKD